MCVWYAAVWDANPLGMKMGLAGCVCVIERGDQSSVTMGTVNYQLPTCGSSSRTSIRPRLFISPQILPLSFPQAFLPHCSSLPHFLFSHLMAPLLSTSASALQSSLLPPTISQCPSIFYLSYCLPYTSLLSYSIFLLLIFTHHYLSSLSSPLLPPFLSPAPSSYHSGLKKSLIYLNKTRKKETLH